MKIALFYATHRPYCTGGVLHRSLERLGHRVEAFDSIDLEWARTPSQDDFDLYLEVHSSRHYHQLPLPQGPRAYWAIDTHINYSNELAVAKNHDFVFVPHVAGVKKMREDLPKKAADIHLLPLAADEATIYERGLERTLDVAFVGQNSEQRRLFRRFATRNFKNAFIGKAYLNEMGKIYSTTKIGLNYSIANELNMRVFEVLGSGAFLLSNPIPETRTMDAVQEGKHYREYHTLKEMRDLAYYYLRHAEEREALAKAGQKLVLEKHTIRERAKQILAVVKQGPQR
ncbi:MAG TPA: glycosyltransferase family 1 protein [Candidatus Diapherotrites archaeon]|uniref:Glycosyltransferase family 1 protein n=1 Tax=Candidatus Iainarchaeum sp. TaxID=3101447 RepID=A0A7J4JDM6_9ARCH|nr:glycosyltransferase family 1 protein [Candidatus Diapherotrites archaeon]